MLAALLVWALPARADWVAFNDHGAGTIGTQTHINATILSCSAAGSTTLKNIVDGSALTATLTVAVAGITTGASANAPAVGTPLASTFDGYVWFDDSASGPQACIQVAGAGPQTLTFSGLDPNKRYVFSGGAVRGSTGGSYSNRWTKIDIQGIDGADAAHQQGANSLWGYMDATRAPGSLVNLEVAMHFGMNTWGDMVQWTNINPGADGSFSVVCSQYSGAVPQGFGISPIAGSSTANSPPYGYGISGIRLEEYTAAECPFMEAYVSPTNYLAVVECTPVTLRARICGGTAPYNYQWYKNGVAIDGEMAISLTLTNPRPAIPPDEYFVYVTDSSPGGSQVALSDVCTNVVTADPTAPALVGAVGAADLTTITVSFSKAISFPGPGAFTVQAVMDPSTLAISSATLTNQTNVILVTAARADKAYKVIIGEGVESCNGLVVTPGSFVQILDNRSLLAYGASWQYNDANVDLLTDWLANDYDDTQAGWQTGPGVFDGKDTGNRATICGQTVGTHFTIVDPALPTYYFRTHLNWPVGADPAASAVAMNVWVDDGIELFVNGTMVYYSTNTVTPGVNDSFSGYLGNTVADPPSAAPAVPLSPSIFQYGDNVIAVYLKQGSSGSSDISMVLALSATISNFLGGGPLTVSNVTTSASLAQCATLNLRAQALGGAPPYSYQWFKGSSPLSNGGNISGATSDHLVIANVQSADAGNYHLQVTDSTPTTVNGADISVAVTPDAAPALVSALSATDLRTITVTFDRPVAISSLTGDDFLVRPTDGSGDIALTSAYVTNGNQVILTTASALQPQNYNLLVVGTRVTSACSGLSTPDGSSIRLVQQILLFGTSVNNEWLYSQDGVDLGTDWVTSDYDDRAWPAGPALFDGKTPQPPGRIGITNGALYELVNTQLALTNAAFPSTGAVIPSYYFRKHFSFLPSPSDVSLSVRRMWDDFGIIYLNGQEAYRSTNIVATNEAFSAYVLLGSGVGDAWWSASTALPKTNLATGPNVLAVYLKQINSGSSDITMGLEVTATVTNFPPLGPRITIVNNGDGTATISWTPAGGTLWYSTDLINWTEGSASNPQDINITTPRYRFYQVR